MVYFDYRQQRHVCSKPSLIPRLRAYRANWRLFHKATRTWPLLSIAAFIYRYLLAIIAVITFLKFTTARHGLKGVFFYRFVGLIFVVAGWFLVERVAWSYDLHQKKIAPDSDIWSDQMPYR